MALISDLPETLPFQVITLKRSRPDMHSGEITLTCLTAFMLTAKDTLISSGVSITLCDAQTCSSLHLRLWILTLAEYCPDRRFRWILPHRFFLPWKGPTWLSLSRRLGRTTNLTAYQYQVTRGSESHGETISVPILLMFLFEFFVR